MATAFTLFSLGDLVTQTCFEKQERVDLSRTFKQALVVGVVLNPCSQIYMSRIAPLVTLKGRAKYQENALKALMHFCVMAPLQNPSFLFFSGYLRNFSLEEGKQNMRLRLKDSLTISLCYWPWVNMVAYQWVSYEVRLPFMNVMAFIYAIMLSYINNR